LEREIAQAIVNATHGETCAYSDATRTNVEVTVSVVKPDFVANRFRTTRRFSQADSLSSILTQRREKMKLPQVYEPL